MPFHWTREALVKPAPLTVMMKLGPPGVAEDGLRLEILGPLGAAMENSSVFEPPAVGVLTVTLAVPAVTMSDAGTVAVN